MEKRQTGQPVRPLSYQQKLATASKLYWNARALKSAYFRSLYPELSEEMIREKVKRWMMYGNS